MNHAARTMRVQQILTDSAIGSLLVSERTNILYLSGFGGSFGWLVITPRRQYIVSDFRYADRIAAEVDPSYEYVDASGKRLYDDVLPSLGLGSPLGFEALSVNFHDAALLDATGIELVPTVELVEELRAIKDPAEVEAIRASQRLTEKIFGELLPLIRPNITELDIAAEIEYRARKHGASGCSFSAIIASGVHSSMPHYSPGQHKLQPGPLTIDLGVVLDNYCSDMTRTVFYKDCTPKWKDVYEVVNHAKDEAFAAIRPGVAARDVDAVARKVITDAGYGEYFRHGLGHGVGLPFKGKPILNWTSDDVLAVGHVASDEPGIYLPGEGGVRIEDLFVVTDDGAENLNELSTELSVIA
ncbi:MAG: Xaa-Pro peptidase family protein [bacterium]|nr:Xaa-Pro peptidase family protein [bacterium]